MSNEQKKPVIGFSCGDINGIGIEITYSSYIINKGVPDSEFSK